MDILKNNYFENCEFTSLSQNNEDLKSKSFYDCVFKGCDFTGSDFTDSLFSECKILSSNLSLVLMATTKMQNAYFHDCKISGVNFTHINTLILQIDFKNSLITDCIFSSLPLKDKDFINCQIKNSDFYQTNLTGSNFSGSNLKDSIFENTNLSKTNFKEAQNYSINPLINKIKDAQFSMPDAITLLKPLGIKIDY